MVEWWWANSIQQAMEEERGTKTKPLRVPTGASDIVTTDHTHSNQFIPGRCQWRKGWREFLKVYVTGMLMVMLERKMMSNIHEYL